LTGIDVAISFALYILVYLLMYPTGVAFMAALVRRGPEGALAAEPIESGRPERPFEQAAGGQPAPDR
jgi:cytochrome d ubiquinol oxidase subunit I